MSSHRTPQRAALAGAILVALAAAATATAAVAPVIAVDGTTCSLANAITTANTNTATGGCTISPGTGTIALVIAGNQTLTAELPRVTAGMAFTSATPTASTISGDGKHRLFFIGDDTHAPTVSFSNLTLSGGVANGGTSNDGGGAGAGLGGAIFMYNGNLSVSNVTFSGNHATGGTSSGGTGTVDSVFAKGGGAGGGMYGVGGRGAYDLSNNFAGHVGGSGGFGGHCDRVSRVAPWRTTTVSSTAGGRSARTQSAARRRCSVRVPERGTRMRSQAARPSTEHRNAAQCSVVG